MLRKTRLDEGDPVCRIHAGEEGGAKTLESNRQQRSPPHPPLRHRRRRARALTCASISRLLGANGGELTRLLTELLLASVSDLDSGLGWSWTPLAWTRPEEAVGEDVPELLLPL